MKNPTNTAHNPHPDLAHKCPLAQLSNHVHQQHIGLVVNGSKVHGSGCPILEQPGHGLGVHIACCGQVLHGGLTRKGVFVKPLHERCVGGGARKAVLGCVHVDVDKSRQEHLTRLCGVLEAMSISIDQARAVAYQP